MPLVPNPDTAGDREQCVLADGGGGTVALRSRANQRFVDVTASGLLPDQDSVTAATRFSLVRNSDGTVSLRAASNSRYVTAGSAGTGDLKATAKKIGAGAKFNLVAK
ncbi:hypothetical protein AB0J83_17510 [Actinoplanes sp. NPDC049596]|uniref:fascin domain-containing protein n=1 Tax=unclassified Actinoplanes TaxID=2626549 RepID=UPI00341ABB3F